MERRDFIKLGLGAAAATALPLPDAPRYRPKVVAPYTARGLVSLPASRCRIPTSLDECFDLMDKEELRRHLDFVDGVISRLIRKQEETIYGQYLPSAK